MAQVLGGGARHLHLGCGPKYLPGFVNIDGNLFNKLDLWWTCATDFPLLRIRGFDLFDTHVRALLSG